MQSSLGEHQKTLAARWVLPITGPPIEDGLVLIENRTVKAVMPRSQFKPESYPREFERVRDYGQAILLPGLINLHTHLDYSDLRCLDVNAPMFEWLKKLVATSSTWHIDQWQQSAYYGAREAALSGCSCVVDSSFTGLSAHALASVGMRGFVGLELFGLKDEASAASWNAWLAKFDILKNSDFADLRVALGTGRIKLTVAPHAPYTVCPTLWLKAATWAEEQDLPLLTHLCESEAECAWLRSDHAAINDHLRFVRSLKSANAGTAGSAQSIPEMEKIGWKGRGLSPVKHLKHFGLLNDHVLAAHAVHVDKDDLALLAQNKVKIAHCPRSNARLGNGCARLEPMRQAGIQFGLGTDSLASCDDLDLLGEARFAINAHRLTEPSFKWTSEQVIRSFTIDAAKILNIDHFLGSLEPGKAADLAIFELDWDEGGGNVDPYALLLHGGCRLRDLFVDGAPVVVGSELINA